MSNIDDKFIFAVSEGDLSGARRAFNEGADVNRIDPHTGLAALHIAVGHNDLRLARALVEEFGSAFFADEFGRWPSVVAVECGVDDAVADYITSAESLSLGQPA